jgi:hypothetical protein
VIEHDSDTAELLSGFDINMIAPNKSNKIKAKTPDDRMLKR